MLKILESEEEKFNPNANVLMKCGEIFCNLVVKLKIMLRVI